MGKWKRVTEWRTVDAGPHILKHLYYCETNEHTSAFLYHIYITNISPLGDITGWEKLSSSLRSFVNNTDIYIGCMEFKLKNTNLNKNPRLFPNKMLSFILTPTTSLGLFCSWFWLSLQGCSQASHKEDRIRQLTFSSCHFKSITGLDLNLHEKYPYE